MNFQAAAQSLTGFALRFVPVLVAAAAKASLVFVLVLLATRVMKRAHPRLRHILWLSVIASYLFILVLSVGRPFFLPGGEAVPEKLRRLSEGSSVLFTVPRAFAEAASNRSGAGVPAPWAPASPWTRNWPAAFLLLWATGVLASFLRMAFGRARLLRLIGSAAPRAPWQPHDLFVNLTARMGITRAVGVLQSTRFRVPFTCRFLRPLIVLPAAMREWGSARLRAVLLHELCHIKRGDCLTQALARAVCCLFWFVPLVWAAFAPLALEQEKACDEDVVHNGVGRQAYATCILEAARLSRQSIPFYGLSFPGRRRRVLADRIRAIVEGGVVMKRGLLAFAVAVFAVCVFVALGGAGRREELSYEQAWGKLVGTWVNQKYAGFQEPQKMVIKTGFVGEDWHFVTDASPDAGWAVKVKKVWTDWKGDTYCQFYWRYTERYSWTGRALIRLNRSGKVLEWLNRKGTEDGEYPALIDPRARSDEKDWYTVYYRK